MRKHRLLSLALASLALAGCSPATESTPSSIASGTQTPSVDAPASGIDYMVLVNKLNPLPEGWEEALEITVASNSLGDEIEVEKKACEAYRQLKQDLEKDGVYIELDSARRSVAKQQEIMDSFTEEYGADYALKTVAQPGYSEHHTGLALDLYLRVDGKDVYYNEDMMQYPEIWEKIHAKIADHGFILRYLEGKEHLTGYGYEPWHIRYIDDVDIAKEIMAKGITFEGYLGAAKETDPLIDYGASAIYTEDDLKEAAVQIKCNFAAWEGFQLQALRYGGDESNSAENLAWLNSLSDENEYVQCAEFLMDFHTPKTNTSLDPDADYQDYGWWLAKTQDSGWEIVSSGY